VLSFLERVKGNYELEFFCIIDCQLLILPNLSFPKNGYIILICVVFLLDNLSFTNFNIWKKFYVYIVLNKFVFLDVTTNTLMAVIELNKYLFSGVYICLLYCSIVLILVVNSVCFNGLSSCVV
jgi:uncharacterized membrane protein